MSRRKNINIGPKNTSRINFKEKLPNYDELRPIFSFCHMEYGGKYCLSKCTTRSRASLVKTILMLSQLTWKQISSIQKESLGKENIPKKQFKVVFDKYTIISPEVESLMVFRFSKSERMAGIRHKNIYEILVVGSNLYNH